MPKKKYQKKFMSRRRKNLRYKYGNFKLRLYNPVLIDIDSQGGTTGDVDSFINVNSLTRSLVPQADSAQLTVGLLDASQIKGLYDQYKVIGVKIKYIPKINNYQVINPEAPVAEYMAGGPMFAIAYDIDNSGAVSTFNELIQRDSVKVKSPFKPWSLYFKIYPTSQINQQISGAANAIGTNGWNDLQQEQNNVAGVIWMRSSDAFRGGSGAVLKGNTEVGTMLVTYYVKARLRQ